MIKCGAVDTRVDVEGIDGGVAHVVIEIKGVEGENFHHVDPPAGYVIRQKDCQFTPSLIVVPNGKDIQVFNDDPVGHNVNTGRGIKCNSRNSRSSSLLRVNRRSKLFSNIHSWMEGWITQAQNPYFAVTDEKGDFTILGVPPGKYRISIWHPSLGRETARLTLKQAKPQCWITRMRRNEHGCPPKKQMDWLGFFVILLSLFGHSAVHQPAAAQELTPLAALPTTPDPARVELGKLLFFDGRLSERRDDQLCDLP
ncbi:MAG: hypothetical protein R3C09_18685 [Pirellulaceae bacterium]